MKYSIALQQKLESYAKLSFIQEDSYSKSSKKTLHLFYLALG